MATETFTINVDTDILLKLDALAGSLNSSRNYLINQAIKDYLDAQTYQVVKITQGIAAADRAELLAHDDVMREMANLIDGKGKALII